MQKKIALNNSRHEDELENRRSMKRVRSLGSNPRRELITAG